MFSSFKNKLSSILWFFLDPCYDFKKKGKNFHYGRNCIFNNPKTMEFGDNCSIGPNAVFYSIYKKIIFGNNVMLGPGVTLVTGDLSFRKVGIPICLNHEKLPSDDGDIVIEDDVWIGANVTILKGVTIGRGSVIAAGSVVTKIIPPYVVAGGIPAKTIAKRFSKEEVIEHEKILYKECDRKSLNELTHL